MGKLRGGATGAGVALSPALTENVCEPPEPTVAVKLPPSQVTGAFWSTPQRRCATPLPVPSLAVKRQASWSCGPNVWPLGPSVMVTVGAWLSTTNVRAAESCEAPHESVARTTSEWLPSATVAEFQAAEAAVVGPATTTPS